MRLLHPITKEENNDPVKKHPFYCYKAQLQFVGWLKQQLRRTDYRGRPGLQVGKGRSSWQLDKLQPRWRCMSTGSNVMRIHHCLFCQGLKRSAEDGAAPLALRMSSWKSNAARRGHSFLAMYWFFINCRQGRFTPPSRVSDTSVVQASVKALFLQ